MRLCEILASLPRSANITAGIEHALTARVRRKADGSIEVYEVMFAPIEVINPDLSLATRYFQQPS